MFVETTAVQKLLRLNKRIKGVQGGTSASKTISIEQILIDLAQSEPDPGITSITSESMPHLKRGAMRDFKNIMQQQGYWEDARWNATDSIYTFPLRDPVTNKMVTWQGNQIEFFSLDMPHKVRGPRRKRLFINEANNIPKETFDQLEVRTSGDIWLDWNPTNAFWFHEDVLPIRDDVDHIILTYKDNEGLPESIVKSIESRKLNKAWWQVYGLGQLGEVEGKIFTGWQIIDDIPHEARLEIRGLDFGFARDPDALCDIYSYNGGYIIDELVYRVGMKDRQLADVILNQPDPNALTIADSADQKAIDLLRELGVNIIGVEKKGFGGEKFTAAAIRYVQGQKVSITKRSTNYIKSYRNFMWQTDREGKIIDKYDHYWSDGMMSVVYGMQAFRPREPEDFTQYSQLTNFAL